MLAAALLTEWLLRLSLAGNCASCPDPEVRASWIRSGS